MSPRKKQPPMIGIPFTDDEIRTLYQLLDIAVKAQGLSVAEAAVPLAHKLAEALAPRTAPQE
jgi:hypothetical protein